MTRGPLRGLAGRGSALRGLAYRRGLMGGSRAWTLLWALAVTARIARRLLHDKPEVIFSGRLEPGQTLEIVHRAPVAEPRRP